MYLLKQWPRFSSRHVTETTPRPCLALKHIKFEAQRHSKRRSLNSNEHSSTFQSYFKGALEPPL